MPILQLSVPGQLITSSISKAPESAQFHEHPVDPSALTLQDLMCR